MNEFYRIILAPLVAILFFNVLFVKESYAQSVLNEILRRMEIHKKSFSSLRSKATMEKYNSQLKESEISEGSLIYSRTAQTQIRLRLDWTKPVTESLYFVNGQYVIYRPRLQQAVTGKMDLTNRNDKLTDALSFVVMSRKEIKANYNIKYIGEKKVKNTLTLHLALTPKKSVFYKYAELYVDGNGMLIQVRVLEKNDDSTTVSLSDLRKNEPISAAIFQPNLPKRTKIIKTSVGACPCFIPDNAKDALKYWSDVVFSGKVTAVKDANYTFKIEKMWKGNLSGETIVQNLSTSEFCGAKLSAGESYVVFAKKVNATNKTVLGLMPCSFTNNTASITGKKILIELGKGKFLRKTKAHKRLHASKRF